MAGRFEMGSMPNKKTTNYQDLSKKLDEIMARFNDEDIDIEEAMALYEEGITIVKELETYLKTAENKVKKIKLQFEK
jgi:exodeoxyribonuclease VII small subunit